MKFNWNTGFNTITQVNKKYCSQEKKSFLKNKLVNKKPKTKLVRLRRVCKSLQGYVYNVKQRVVNTTK